MNKLDETQVTLTVNTDSVDELRRLLQLAGMSEEGEEDCGCDEDPTVGQVVGAGPVVRVRAFEADHANEGWLDKEALPGAEYEAGDPEDAIEVDFADSNIRKQRKIKDEEEKIAETLGTIDYDYGHPDYGSDIHVDTHAVDHRTHAHAKVRYVPAQSGDNPMVEEGDPEDEAYNDRINDAVRRIGRGADRDDVAEQEARDIAEEFGQDWMAVKQEILDQSIIVGESKKEARKLEESIRLICEDRTDEFVSALRKVRSRLYENLDDKEISSLAATFINLMRDEDGGRVDRLHRMFRRYLGEAEIVEQYKRFTNEAR